MKRLLSFCGCCVSNQSKNDYSYVLSEHYRIDTAMPTFCLKLLIYQINIKSVLFITEGERANR